MQADMGGLPISGGISSGPSFPGSPSDNDLHFRTDLDLLCFYNSATTSWMTVQEYTLSGTQYGSLPFHSVNAVGALRFAVPSDYGIYLTRLVLMMYVINVNGGGSYWNYNLYQFTGAEVQIGGALATKTTASQAADTYVQNDVVINTAVSSTACVIYDHLTKTGTPGNVGASRSLLYRKIIT